MNQEQEISFDWEFFGTNKHDDDLTARWMKGWTKCGQRAALMLGNDGDRRVLDVAIGREKDGAWMGEIDEERAWQVPSQMTESDFILRALSVRYWTGQACIDVASGNDPREPSFDFDGPMTAEERDEALLLVGHELGLTGLDGE